MKMALVSVVWGLLVPASKSCCCAASVDRSPSVKRVVLTSSVVALYADPHERGKEHVFTDADWGISASETVLPYFHSKKLAEQRAWEIAKKQSRCALYE